MSQPPSHHFSVLPRTGAVLQDGITQKLHIGVQLYVVQKGRIVIDAARGEARPGVLMRPDTLMLWLSAGKPLTAVAIA
ncbi:MAG: serine hydrolase, partial [Phycisphaerae bacterium]